MSERAHYDPDPVVRSQAGKGLDFAVVVKGRASRRDVLKFAGATVGALAATPVAAVASAGPASDLGFAPIQATTEDAFIVPQGFVAQPVLAWGDPIDPSKSQPYPGTPLSAEEQARRFGYNCDYVGFIPLKEEDGTVSRAILGVNHEYVNPEIMAPKPEGGSYSDELLASFREAVGFSVVEIELADGRWRPVEGSKLSRRISLSTPHEISGPGRGSAILATSADPDATTIIGTMANCAGGTTPWGTFLSGEENFQDSFAGVGAVTDPKTKAAHARYGVAEKSEFGLERIDPRFDCAQEPNEPFRFGWVVEVDPFDPEWAPRKRTALGRFRHEGSTTHVTKGGRLVQYSGCDARFEYVYKFVASKQYDPDDRLANRDLLDEGTLYVARFDDDGTGKWLPLVHGQGPLTEENGFADQADVVVRARMAADAVGATKMDRPEDIEVNPANQKVYVVCTNNTDRGKEGKEGANQSNPRDANRHGHIIELTEADDDHAATEFQWELLLVCGDPSDPTTYFAGFDKSQVAPISCPDNLAFDQGGNLWIATDGQPRSIQVNDGLYVVPVEGPERGKLRQFLSVPRGAECAGPCFASDFRTLFVSVQHPGEGGSFEAQTSRWPDGTGAPRPTVMAVRAEDGGIVGGKFGTARRDALRGLADALVRRYW